MCSTLFDCWLSSDREVYLSCDEAVECIERCQQEMIAVIGIEVFHKKGGKLIPDPDGICDWGGPKDEEWEGFCADCNELSLRFLCALPRSIDTLVTLVALTRPIRSLSAPGEA